MHVPAPLFTCTVAVIVPPTVMLQTPAGPAVIATPRPELASAMTVNSELYAADAGAGVVTAIVWSDLPSVQSSAPCGKSVAVKKSALPIAVRFTGLALPEPA
jgi:hypothetical protein